MIIYNNLSKMKNEYLAICLQGHYGDSLGEFGNTSNGVVGKLATAQSSFQEI